MMKNKLRQKIINLILFVVTNTIAISSYADNVIDNPALLYMAPLPDDSALSQKITINHTFNNINELVTRLNTISGISAVVKSQSISLAAPVSVVLNNGTIVDLLNSTAKKFGYSWAWNDNVITFSPLAPLMSSNIGKTLPDMLHPQVARISPVVMTWKLDPKDRMLRNALTKWCKNSGWQLIWNVNADFPIVTAWTINGSFETAVNQVLQASQQTNMPLLATMHDSNKVLEIYSPSSVSR